MTTTKVKYIAADQHGHILHILNEHPRKFLMDFHQATHADKMYVNDGEHVGYVVKGFWYTLYAVEGRGPRMNR